MRTEILLLAISYKTFWTIQSVVNGSFTRLYRDQRIPNNNSIRNGTTTEELPPSFSFHNTHIGGINRKKRLILTLMRSLFQFRFWILYRLQFFRHFVVWLLAY